MKNFFFQNRFRLIQIALFLTVLILFFNGYPLFSSNKLENRIGVGVSANYLSHKTDIPYKWNSSDCGIFGNSNSLGYGAGIQYSYLLWDDILWLDLRLNYNSMPIHLNSIAADYEVYNPKILSYVPLNINHSFNSTMHYMNFEPGILIQPLSSVPFKIRLAFDAGYPVFGADYETSEEIQSPKIYSFPDNTQRHTTQKGELRMVGLNYSAIGGLLYDFELSDNLFLQAGVNYEHPSGSSIYDAKLETSTLGVSLSLQYAFGTEIEIKPPKIDTPKVEQKVEPVIVKKNPHIEIQPSQLEVMETIVTQTYPILPYIFFDSSSSVLKSGYSRSGSGSFEEKNLPNETLKIYYAVLDIIGSRLKSNPQSEITITGMSDGRELESTQYRLDLAMKRAKTVADYFSSKWNIEDKRLIIKTRETPELATSTIYNEGYDENRRVEISSPQYDILKPVIYSKFSEYELLSKEINNEIKTENSDSSGDPRISLYAGNKEIGSMQVSNTDTSSTFIFDDNQKKNITDALNHNQPVTVKYEYDYEGKKHTLEKNPFIKKNANQFEIGRLNLIVFDFDKSEVNRLNSELIKNFVASSIEDNSTVGITGSTDRLGEKDYNLELSQSRAENTYDFIKKIKPKSEFREVKGIGDSNLLYDNNLPEGRFYCRTVLIEVTTPVK
ncbi:MAG: hypothetical protein EPN82_14330 [Bacteroidetes bacterium]|nr:MAG: hypothetical protein EPN82_14330 [Bacteroidota bacterium]